MTEGDSSDRLAAIARNLDADAVNAAASGVLGFPVSFAEPPSVAPLSVHHYDSRTIGMLHVSGQASDARGQFAPWSCVIKIIDLHQPPRANTFVDAASEILVYRSRLFADDETMFRPARCYLVSQGQAGTTLLWLEDLTGLQKPPFTLEELAGMSAHLGAWNARHALVPPALPFEAGTNAFLLRWSRAPAVRQVGRLRALHEHRYVRDAFRDVPLEALEEFLLLVERLNAMTSRLKPSLAFGDCNVGNLFSGDGETVAVDWASLTGDPLGVDAGCMVGSAISWGREGGAVARNERELFDTYVEALSTSGLDPQPADIRKAYYGQYGYYVCMCATMPALLVDEVFPIHLVEKRFGAPAGEIPALVAGVVDQLPTYIKELRLLLG